MEAVNNEDAEGIDELWGVSCKKKPYLNFFWNKTTIIISIEPCLFHMIVIADNPNVMPMTICICFMLQGFETLMRALQVKESDADYLEPQSFKTSVREWAKLFLQMYYDDDITPYIHSMFTENFT